VRQGITKRHYASKIVGSFVLFLGLIFSLYVLVDYTSRATNFDLSTPDLAIYYLFTFISRLDVLAPFASLTAVIQTVTQSNSRNELVAIRASGQSLSSALSPLVLIALITTACIYVNEQLAIPKAIRWIEEMETSQSQRPEEGHVVRHLALRDGSQLLFRSYSRSRKEFGDSYWLRGNNDLFRMQALSLYESIPEAHYVEHLQRDEAGRMVLVEQWTKMSLPDLRINQQDLLQTVTPPLERSLTQLWSQLPAKNEARLPKDASFEAAFWKKMALPWLCLIATLAPVPFCIPHKKPLRIFYIFAGGLFGLFILYIALSAGYTLATHDLAPAWLVLPGPVALAAGVSVALCMRMR